MRVPNDDAFPKLACSYQTMPSIKMIIDTKQYTTPKPLILIPQQNHHHDLSPVARKREDKKIDNRRKA